jgi:hypothetical protein
MKSNRPAHTLAAALLFLLAPRITLADLGIVLSRESQGPLAITVFSASEPVQGRAADFSVLVQRCDSNDPILDANVSLAFTPPRTPIIENEEPICGQLALMKTITTYRLQVGTQRIEARHEHSTDKLLYAALVNFPVAGQWKLETSVRHGANSAKFTCEIPVGLPSRRIAGLAPYLALPAILVALFAMNQWLRNSRSTK